ncbi:MAG TPA: hypothetical protein VER55_12820, partial [Ardenticatenaceae bacterium]|nr:hypothetical protein [Ardenticatenaceae bacterium]
MRTKVVAISVIVVVTLLLSAAGSSAQGPEPVAPNEAQAPLGSAFTYQGQLLIGGEPASGRYDFEFRLFGAASGGALLGGPVALDDVEVQVGRFTVELDFGAGAFNGQARWLEIRVREGGSDGAYTPLSPRQRLAPAPYALWSLRAPWGGLAGVPAGFADGVDNDTTYSAGTGLALEGTVLRLAGSYRLPQGCAAGRIARWDGSAWVCAQDDAGAGGDITAV